MKTTNWRAELNFTMLFSLLKFCLRKDPKILQSSRGSQKKVKVLFMATKEPKKSEQNLFAFIETIFLHVLFLYLI